MVLQKHATDQYLIVALPCHAKVWGCHGDKVSWSQTCDGVIVWIVQPACITSMFSAGWLPYLLKDDACNVLVQAQLNSRLSRLCFLRALALAGMPSSKQNMPAHATAMHVIDTPDLDAGTELASRPQVTHTWWQPGLSLGVSCSSPMAYRASSPPMLCPTQLKYLRLPCWLTMRPISSARRCPQVSRP